MNNLDLIYNDEESHFKSILAYNSRRLDTTNVYYNKTRSARRHLEEQITMFTTSISITRRHGILMITKTV